MLAGDRDAQPLEMLLESIEGDAVFALVHDESGHEARRVWGAVHQLLRTRRGDNVLATRAAQRLTSIDATTEVRHHVLVGVHANTSLTL